MIRRIEKIELIGNNSDELMKEAIRDIEEKRNAGWELVYHLRDLYGTEFCIKYCMERRFSYDQNAV